MDEYIVSTSSGLVQGKSAGRCTVFLGVPYARAGRFCPPERSRWEGVLPCTDFGPSAPQPNYRGVKPEGFAYAMIGGEDCLRLNIWTPRLREGAALPVVINVYGGAFQVGRTDTPAMDGAAFMEQDDMVYVSVNYRVGVLGFLELGDRYGGAYRGSGNNGILDLVTAVEWVYENIAAFGGDPERITVMGISAGAKCIGTLMTMPRFQRLVHSVLLESGAMQALRTPESAEAVTRRYLALLPAGADVLAMPAAELVEAQAELCSVEGCTCFFGPVLEPPLSPDWMERWAKGERFTGRAMIGSGRHELVNLVSRPGFLSRAEAVARDMFGAKNGALAAKKAAELMEHGGAELQSWEAVFSDFMYRFYSNALARQLESEGNPVWVYSFDYAPGCHGQGFAFLQGQIDPPGGRLEGAEREGARRLSDFFRRRVREFILCGQPEESLWSAYRGGSKMILADPPHMEYRPDDTLTGFPPAAFCEE